MLLGFDINALIIFGAIVCAVIAFCLGFWLGTNVKRSLDQVSDGADGDTEPTPTYRIETDKFTEIPQITQPHIENVYWSTEFPFSVRAENDKTPENGTEG